MNITAHVKNHNNKRKKKLFKQNIFLSSLNNLLKKSDFIIIVVPLYNQTKNLINSKNLRLLKKNSILINISRGGIVNEAHLYNALVKKNFLQRQLMFLDKKKYNKLFKLDNIVVTPHMGAMTYKHRKE